MKKETFKQLNGQNRFIFSNRNRVFELKKNKTKHKNSWKKEAKEYYWKGENAMTDKNKLYILMNRRNTILNKGKSTPKLIAKLDRQIVALINRIDFAKGE